MRSPLLVLVVAVACTPNDDDTSSAASNTSTPATTDNPATTTSDPDPTTSPTSAGPTGSPTGDPTSSPTATSEPDPGSTSHDNPGSTSTTTTDPGTTASYTTSVTAGASCDPDVHMGKATYSAADGSGNCSFDANPGDPLVAAMNTTDYAASAVCGACVAIDGPDGSITVRIVDRCPECPQGNIDLAEGAFPMIADKQLGIVPISWQYVSCPVAGNIVYHFKEGSNQWWTAVQVRNHRNAIAKFEYRAMDNTWKDVARVDYNFFIDESGMGPGPYDFRVTDVAGNTLEDHAVPFIEAGDSPGAGQFPACTP